MVGIALTELHKVIAVKRPRVWGLYFKKWRKPLESVFPQGSDPEAPRVLYGGLYQGGWRLQACDGWVERQRELSSWVQLGTRK